MEGYLHGCAPSMLTLAVEMGVAGGKKTQLRELLVVSTLKGRRVASIPPGDYVVCAVLVFIFIPPQVVRLILTRLVRIKNFLRPDTFGLLDTNTKTNTLLCSALLRS